MAVSVVSGGIETIFALVNLVGLVGLVMAEANRCNITAHTDVQKTNVYLL